MESNDGQKILRRQCRNPKQGGCAIDAVTGDLRKVQDNYYFGRCYEDSDSQKRMLRLVITMSMLDNRGAVMNVTNVEKDDVRGGFGWKGRVCHGYL